MENDLNNLNQFLGDHDSFHFPAPTQDRTIRKSSVEFKHPQHLISPANIQITNKHFMMLHSPSPFKHPVSFYQQEQSEENFNRDSFSVEPRSNQIAKLLIFQHEDSPQKKNYQSFSGSTASSMRISNRSPQIKLISKNVKEQKRNSKGLRNLSESVYKIVLDLKVTTYKQVADQLVRMLNAGEFGPYQEDDSKQKDQQNIKRRVYDALNVLISADVLKKNGKFVMSQQDAMSEKLKSSSRNAKKQDKDNLFDQIIKKQNLLRQKRSKIDELKNKREILNALLKRNRKKKHQQKQKIVFPLIGITFKRTIPKITRNQSRSKVSVPLLNLLEVIGDMDLILKIGIDPLVQNIEEIIEDVNNEDQIDPEPIKKKTKTEISNQVVNGRQRVARVLYSL